MDAKKRHTQNKYGLCSVTGHIEKHVKVDNVSENFCFKLRLLFHISMLSCFFFSFNTVYTCTCHGMN